MSKSNPLNINIPQEQIKDIIKDIEAKKEKFEIKAFHLNDMLPIRIRRDSAVLNDTKENSCIKFAEIPAKNKTFIWVVALYHKDIKVVSVCKEIWDEILKLPTTRRVSEKTLLY